MPNLTTTSRAARTIAAGVVATVAAIASYSHMRVLAAEHGQGALLANLLPLSVDGMLIVASAVTAEDRAAGRPVRLSARVSFVVGVAASIVANVLAAQPDMVARVISAWPALALLLAVEMLTGGRRMASVGQTVSELSDGTAAPAGIAAETAVRIAAAMAAKPDADRDEIAATAGVSTRTVRRYLAVQPA